MTSLQALFTEGEKRPLIPKTLLKSFPNISSDPEIRSGWPHIRNTRILVTDIFRAQVRGNSYESLLSDFKDIGVKIDKKALEEAYRFTIEWLHHLNAKKTSKASY